MKKEDLVKKMINAYNESTFYYELPDECEKNNDFLEYLLSKYKEENYDIFSNSDFALGYIHGAWSNFSRGTCPGPTRAGGQHANQ